ncbi:Holliday junction resolvase RecU [Mesoplasma lactucae]|uniref:Holliday junction resolvase RecU n=1 Tax=Mesoplasma lactucae ATCC 49193 TaxID=81460 RepID=A0A291IR96_9MOLU|nr:Holliday junction resolvase RecU [Mesoplasma lactucae]ATG97293.1 Holliday junction resolvase RecU [Mesoplasma lactucae ATCC 49193]ATZ20257.1 Holliday junction-specific endonuclease [Mesoplasma lactucae ATCC 49193]MCL8216428.1 Holliday junction resolvase RecU [Mesoplasma lactucae ATCC 49193]
MNPIKNKGLFLEEVLNITNQKYIDSNKAIVNKIPTNIKLIKANDNLINKAIFKEGSNCDYVGCYKGCYFEFEAKETIKDSFSYQNLRKNQITELNRIVDNHGIAFIIVYFSSEERFFICDWLLMKNYFIKFKKTIPLEWFIENTAELFINSHLELDYLKEFNRLTNHT